MATKDEMNKQFIVGGPNNTHINQLSAGSRAAVNAMAPLKAKQRAPTPPSAPPPVVQAQRNGNTFASQLSSESAKQLISTSPQLDVKPPDYKRTGVQVGSGFNEAAQKEGVAGATGYAVGAAVGGVGALAKKAFTTATDAAESFSKGYNAVGGDAVSEPRPPPQPVETAATLHDVPPTPGSTLQNDPAKVKAFLDANPKVREFKARETDQQVFSADTNGDGKADSFSDFANRGTLVGGKAAPIPGGDTAIVTNNGITRRGLSTAEGTDIYGNSTRDTDRYKAKIAEYQASRPRRQASAPANQFAKQAQQMLEQAAAIEAKLPYGERGDRAKRRDMLAQIKDLRSSATELAKSGSGSVGDAIDAQKLQLDQQRFLFDQNKFGVEQQNAAADRTVRQFNALEDDSRARIELLVGDKEAVPDFLSKYNEIVGVLNSKGAKLPADIRSASLNDLGEVLRAYQAHRGDQAGRANDYIPFNEGTRSISEFLLSGAYN